MTGHIGGLDVEKIRKDFPILARTVRDGRPLVYLDSANTSQKPQVVIDAMVDHIRKHFSEHGFGLWAIEVPGVAPFVGFAGLAVTQFTAHFTPCVEVGWRLAFEHWGHGYATEAARLALGYAFGTLALPEVVSFTSVGNHRSRAVMERLGMRRNSADDFDYPSFPEGHPLRRHVLYRLGSGARFDAG
jgi:RimJ/RimL family protein N-acetyltransferase